MVFRVVYHDALTEKGFYSNERWGVSNRHSLSTWSALSRAGDLARWQVRRGFVTHAYMAAIDVDKTVGLRVEPGPPPSGQRTLWGGPQAILAQSRIVEQVG